MVEDVFPVLQLSLTEESKSIFGFKVKKAQTNRIFYKKQLYIKNGIIKKKQVTDTIKIDAWYAPDIPFRFGPEDY